MAVTSKHMQMELLTKIHIDQWWPQV